MELNYQNESLTENSDILPIKNELPFIKGSLSVCKIEINCYEGDYGKRKIRNPPKSSFGTGFFLKIKHDENENEYQYYLVSCEHVIQKEIIEKNNEILNYSYFYESRRKSIILNTNERFIKEYMTDNNADITIVQILKEDEIPIEFFLEPDYSIKDYKKYRSKEIIIHQFPNAGEQAYSFERITEIKFEDRNKVGLNISNQKTYGTYQKNFGNYIQSNQNKNIGALFIHYKASTQPGSSGSPIMVKGSENVIGVHNSRGDYKKLGYTVDDNRSNFLIDVLEDVQRKEDVEYFKEEYINDHSLTKKNILVIKKHNCIKFQNYKGFNINLKIKEDINNNCYDIKLIFTDILTKEKYFIKKKTNLVEKSFLIFEQLLNKELIITEKENDTLKVKI